MNVRTNSTLYKCKLESVLIFPLHSPNSFVNCIVLDGWSSEVPPTESWLLKFLSNLKVVRYFSLSFCMTVIMHAQTCMCMYVYKSTNFLAVYLPGPMWCFFNVLITLSLFLPCVSFTLFMVYWTLRCAHIALLL